MLVQNRRLPESVVALTTICTLAALVATVTLAPAIERLFEPAAEAATAAPASVTAKAAPVDRLARPAFVGANQRVAPFKAPYRFGVNLGWRDGWTNAQMASIAGTTGATSARISLPEWLFSEFGYDFELQNGDFAAYDQAGLRDLTAVLTGPIPEHSNAPADGDREHYSPKSLYAPIWLKPGVVNPDNTWATYVYQTVSTYRGKVRVWEVWNEPDFADNWETPQQWWTRAPAAGELPSWHDSVFAYNRLLRITYEVAKSVDPDTLIATGGLGHESFLNAMLRYTDDPDGGALSDAYPARGGAYFDVLSYHYYPEYGVEDLATGAWIQATDSDADADGLILKQRNLDRQLRDAGYDGATYPEKHWIVTETGFASKPVGDTAGSVETMTNYLAKLPVVAQAADLKQVHWYVLTDQEARESATKSFDHMGLYFDVAGVPFGKQEAKSAAAAYATASRLLSGRWYDAAATAKLALPDGARGHAFDGVDHRRTLVLWARTSGSTETATAQITLPAERPLTLYRIGTAANGPGERLEPVDGAISLTLTATPVFLVEAER